MSEKSTEEGVEHTLTLEVKNKLLVIFDKRSPSERIHDFNVDFQDCISKPTHEDGNKDKNEKEENKGLNTGILPSNNGAAEEDKYNSVNGINLLEKNGDCL